MPYEASNSLMPASIMSAIFSNVLRKLSKRLSFSCQQEVLYLYALKLDLLALTLSKVVWTTPLQSLCESGQNVCEHKQYANVSVSNKGMRTQAIRASECKF